MVPQPEAEPYGAQNCVLVVDDDAVIRLIVAETMRDAGLCVVEARSGADALNYLSSGGRIDLIFSDIQMPGPIDGLALARHVHAKYPAIPVILTSGKVKPPGIGNIAGFIPKPYGVGRLLAMVTQVLSSMGKTAT
jgi:CheY-like chemotaxis protein